MGGIISLASVEKFPAFYDGALPLCGWLAPVYSLMKRALDMLVIYDYFFGRNNGRIIDEKAFIEQDRIKAQIDKKTEISHTFWYSFHD